MKVKQQIFPKRREYTRWVNDQTLEDYALRFTAKGSRRWSVAHVANTALGAISFLILEAIGAAITLNYGFDNAFAAITVVSTIIFLVGLPICYYAAKYGVDIDLLTRGAGFGYIGSTATSLIYSSFTFIFFALEAAVMAKALELLFSIPLAAGYVISSLVVIPMVFYGISFISRFQLWSQPIWILLQLTPFVFIIYHDASLFSEWQHYQGSKQSSPGIDILLFGSAASVLFALVAQTGEQVDFLRFLPEQSSTTKTKWWTALILAGPGWIIIGGLKLLAGSFLAYVAIKGGTSIADASDPTTMYTVAFSYVTGNPHLALMVAGIFVILSQLKINLTNAYAGSIAWSNFFSRLTYSHPGRVVWLVFNVAIALMLMELGIYQAFEHTLSIYAIVAVSWVGALVADLVINKPLGLSPPHIEFKRAHLYDFNPVGIGAMLTASCFGILAYLGFMGQYLQVLAHFLALFIAFICVPFIAVLTKSKYYIARKPHEFSTETQVVECSICQNTYETEDMAHCPAYQGFICSLCCSLDSRCNDSCKDSPKVVDKPLKFINKRLPSSISKYIDVHFIHFVVLLVLVGLVTTVFFALIYKTMATDNVQTNTLLSDMLYKVFFILMIIAGVISWLFTLAHDSRRVAQEESRTQTMRLLEEIEAHKKTDRLLQKSKENAEAANNAKSRYLTGISHELRTPLNTVLGYAQLLETDLSLNDNVREQIITIRRSSQHLADLIEGLLDISKIEAGRLDIQRNKIDFPDLMNQLVKMFDLEAAENGLDFVYIQHSPLPHTVLGDEKRIRQILINLLSNAVKFTPNGDVKFSFSYRNEVAKFKIIDSGVGISNEDLDRIFQPFERVRRPDTPAVPGTGLGLTISRLLTDIMGGEIEVSKNPDGGTIFTLWLALSNVFEPTTLDTTLKPIVGYKNERKSIMVVDDDPTHRGLIGDLLTPLGFVVIEAHDANACLDMLESFEPDLFLLDRLMPGMSGTALSEKLRDLGYNSPIIIVSANAFEDDNQDQGQLAYDDYLVKPIKLNVVLEKLSQHLGIQWRYAPNEAIQTNEEPHMPDNTTLPDEQTRIRIISEAKIGHLNGLRNLSQQLKTQGLVNQDFIKQFDRYIKEINFDKIIDLVKVE